MTVHELAPGVAIARGGPGRSLNVYLLGTIVVDSGVRWSRHRLERQLAGRRITAHMLTHAHFDHAGASAWLCETFDVPLWCGAGDVEAISSGRTDTHGSRLLNRLQRSLLPVTACPVDRALQEGDVVGDFEVLEVPGHSPGALAFWRARDRVLICGDVLTNLGLPRGQARLAMPPPALSFDDAQNLRAVRRLAELRPRVACFGHGSAITDPGRFAADVEQVLQSRLA
jgi:hydroxyacylglutathione hydrolase